MMMFGGLGAASVAGARVSIAQSRSLARSCTREIRTVNRKERRGARLISVRSFIFLQVVFIPAFEASRKASHFFCAFASWRLCFKLSSGTSNDFLVEIALSK